MKLQLAFSIYLSLLDSTSSFQVNRPYSSTTATHSQVTISSLSILPPTTKKQKSLLILKDQQNDDDNDNDDDETTTTTTVGGGESSSTNGGTTQENEIPELTEDEVNLISAIAQTDTSSLDSFLMTNLSNMPSHVILTLRNASEGNLPSYATTKFTKEQCNHLQTVGQALVTIMDTNLKAGRDLLQAFLACGEIRKLDAAIGKAMKEGKIDMSFFTVLNMNIRDAAMEQTDQGETLSKTEEGEFGTGDNANRYQILQHIYTRCQEEVEKAVSPGVALLNKLLRTDQDGIRANQLRHYLCPQAPKTITSPDGKSSVDLPGSKALVKPSELIDALQNAIRQIRTVEKTGTVDVSAAAALVESCRQVAIEARLAIGEGYGVDSQELKDFELSLQPVFRPANAESEYIKGE